MQGADDDELEEEDNRPTQRNQSARRQSKMCVPLVSSVVWDGGLILQHGKALWCRMHAHDPLEKRPAVLYVRMYDHITGSHTFWH
jgi:hypothetical protein